MPEWSPPSAWHVSKVLGEGGERALGTAGDSLPDGRASGDGVVNADTEPGRVSRPLHDSGELLPQDGQHLAPDEVDDLVDL